MTGTRPGNGHAPEPVRLGQADPIPGHPDHLPEPAHEVPPPDPDALALAQRLFGGAPGSEPKDMNTGVGMHRFRMDPDEDEADGYC